MAKKMKVWVFDRYGPPDVLALRERDVRSSGIARGKMWLRTNRKGAGASRIRPVSGIRPGSKVLAVIPSGGDGPRREVNWLVADAMRMEVAIPVIAQSVMQLFLSRDSDKDWAKAIAMMRHGFGGHAYGPSKAARKERVDGRVAEISPEPPPSEATP